jgi:hypothetical protein
LTKPSSLVSRHPYLTRDQLAILLESSNVHIAAIEHELCKRGCVRTVRGEAVGRVGHEERFLELALVELTRAGWRVALDRSLLQTRRAERYQGLSDTSARGQLFRHLSHTVGADSVFVALAHAARVVNERGGDEVLEECGPRPDAFEGGSDPMVMAAIGEAGQDMASSSNMTEGLNDRASTWRS